MRFLIIRHGEPYYPTDSLTEKGQREAECLAKKLIHEDITKIYVSPLGRAQLTAKPTLDALGMEAEVLPWLREFPAGMNEPHNKVASWNQEPAFWTKIDGVFDRTAWRNAPEYRDTKIPEVYDSICRQFDDFMTEWGFRRNADGFYDVLPAGKARYDTVCLFCHLGLGNALISHLMNASLPLVWHTNFLPTSSVTTVVMEPHDNDSSVARLVGIGDTSHLFACGEPISASGLFGGKVK